MIMENGDPKQRHISVDYTSEKEELHQQFNETIKENETLKSELEDVQSKLQEDLEKERTLVEHLEEQNDQLCIDISQLQTDHPERLSDAEKDELMRRCQETQEILEQRLRVARVRRSSVDYRGTPRYD